MKTNDHAASTDASLNTPSFFTGGMLAVLAIAFFKLVLHCVFNNRYGYFRDEFDYLACGDHLAWGYVDQPPLLPFLVRISRAVLGESLRSIRFLPALATSLAVVLTALIAREFGGRRFALVLSAVAVLIAPIYLSGGSLLTTNCLEPLLWMGCAYSAILAVKRDPRYWICFGVVAGLGLQEKYSIAIFGFGIVVGLLLTKHRRALLSKWFWLGGLAAFVIFLPNLIWNVQHHWPFLELMHNIKTTGKDVELSPVQFFAQQILLLHPLTAPIWIAGLIALLFSQRLKNFRFLGWCYLISFAAFVVLKGKNYYLGPIYPMLFAAGAIILENGIERIRQGWLKPVTLILLLACGAWFAPLVVPILPIDRFIAYMGTLPFKVPRTEHSHMSAALPQHYADQFGWEEMTALTAQAWSRLKPEERPDCGIFAQDYGQAGAIDFFGRRYGLPPALSGHQTYFLWGPRGYSGNCLIVLDDRKEVLEEKFESVEYVGSSDNPYALERNIPVYICKGAKFGSLAQIWPKLKKWR
ncbi:MAG TPA: glycosyltransferase family 39 protein [Pyrinomonadaceae bacterium]|jgi:4-amino-4-deoxy-L-arabinose transferase-like glycosyltransferase|nr:glycosyltransferase family 39 protein [Pyrinomonadaceae bacterium]